MPDHQQRVKALFNSVVELDSANARAAYLEQHCGDDAQLRAEVMALVDHDGQLDEFLAEPAALLNAKFLPSSEPLGAHIGPYKLRELIGEGGFGLVYVAEQERPIRRKVALKVIKPGMDSREVIARFEAERQALALMDHPNIAKVFDAGTTGGSGIMDSGFGGDATDQPLNPESRLLDPAVGRPYFVMELVRGLTITDYCDQAKLSLQERIKLFITVCHAVQHAHQKGIIHRDLKPSNVMISLHDGKPVPKVIDFGVAKALNQKLTEHTLYTRHAQILGTPLYMSPEQAELSALDIDTRSDVYSLGVLLYELLTGRTPIDKETLSSLGYDELRRMVLEVDPPRPSARVSTLVGEDRSTVANRRAIDERQHSRTLKGELDWIVMKALEKDRRRRYGSAEALADDAQRHIDDQPVQACPPSTSYRIRKYAVRNSALLTTVSLVLITAILGTAASLRYAYLAAIEAERANFAQEVSNTREQEAESARQRSRSLQYATDIKLASDALAKDDVMGAFDLLQKHSAEAEPSAPRGFEWRLFNRLVSREPVIEIDQGDWVNDVAASADGRWLAVTAAEGEVRVYQTDTWALHCSFPTQTGSVNGLVWSPDGELLAAGCSDGGVRIWRFRSSELLMTIPAHDGETFDVAMSPDGRHLYSCGTDNLARKWDIESGQIVLTFEGHTKAIERIALSADGTKLATASSDESFSVWETDTAQRLRHLWPETGRMMCVDFSPDGRLVAAGDSQGYLYVADVATGHSQLLNQQVDGIDAVAFLPDGDALLATDRAGAIAAWRVPSASDLERWVVERPVRRWKAHEGRAGVIEPISGGATLVSGGRDGVMRVWKTAASAVRWSTPRGQAASEFAVGPDDRLYVAGIEISVWDLRERRLVESFAEADSKWKCLALSDNGEYLAAAQAGRVILFELASRQIVDEWPLDLAWDPHMIALSPDGKIVALSDFVIDKEITLFQRGHRGAVQRLPAQQCGCLRFSPDGRWLATNDLDDLRLIDLQAGGKPYTHPAHSHGFPNLAFSPDGGLLATVGGDRLLKLWRMPECEQLFSIVAHDDAVQAVAISPDARTVATAGDDRRVKLWHVATGQPLGELRPEFSGFRLLDFDQSGQRLVGRLKNGLIVVYDGTASSSRNEVTQPSPWTEGFSTVSPEFQGLGFLSGGHDWSKAEAVSSDGGFVSGISHSASGYLAFRWSRAEGLTPYPGKNPASAVSDDGATLCGRVHGKASFWTSTHDWELSDSEWSKAADLSADGSVIVGQYWKKRWKAFRWEDGKTELLPSPMHKHSQAVATTPSGELVLGRVFNTSGASGRTELKASRNIADSRPVLWGKQGFQLPPGFDPDANWWPTDFSADGTVIVGMRWPKGEHWGSSTDAGRAEAFRWESGDVTMLGHLPSYQLSSASSVSGDGRLIVGNGVQVDGEDRTELAFLWDIRHGMRPLQDALADAGVLTQGWSLNSAQAISNDGTTVVGFGQNLHDKTEAWRVRLPQSLTDSLDEHPAGKRNDQRPEPHESPSVEFITLGFTASDPMISREGHMIVGQISLDDDKHPFYWTDQGSLGVLSLPDHCEVSRLALFDAEGGPIVARVVPHDSPYRVAHWMNRYAQPTLIESPPGWRHTYANTVTGDVIGGQATATDEKGSFPWVADHNGFRVLPRPEGITYAAVMGISADGSTVIGVGWTGYRTLQSDKSIDAKVLRWWNGTVEELPGFTEGYAWYPIDISADASVIVGHCWRKGDAPRIWRNGQAFRWEAGQLQFFDGFPSAKPYCRATAVSADGRVMVGGSLDDNVRTAFVWDEDHGLRRLNDVVQLCGADLDGWHLESAVSISADGRKIVGSAAHNEGASELFLLRLPPSVTGESPNKSESDAVVNESIP